MKITQEKFSGYVIESYEPGSVSVLGPNSPGDGTRQATTYRHSIIVSPEAIIPDWPPHAFDQLQAVHFEQLLRFVPEVVLFGSGNAIRFPSPELIRPLFEAGIGIEVMDTAAACRTYNILAAEGRLVAAGLLIEQ